MTTSPRDDQDRAAAAPGGHPASSWNQRYAAEGYLFGEAPNRWLASHAGLFRAGQRALCVADGEGRNGVWLATLGLQVDAFDVSDVALAKARRLAARAGVTLRLACAGVEDYAWPEGGCDHVVAVFVQFARPEVRARMFERMIASLRPGGTLLLLGYTPQQLAYRTGGPAQVDQLYTVDLLVSAFGELEILELRSFEDTLEEGTAHAGRSALVGLVARRRAS